MAGADLAVGAVSLVVAVDPVRGIGEPDRAVGLDDYVVGAVEALPLVAIGDDGDRPVVLGARDAPRAVLAAHEPTLAVDGVAVGVARRGAEDADVPGRLVPAQHAVVRDVAPHEVAAGGEVGRALVPATAIGEPLEPRAALDAEPEAVLDDLEDVVAEHGRQPYNVGWNGRQLRLYGVISHAI